MGSKWRLARPEAAYLSGIWPDQFDAGAPGECCVIYLAGTCDTKLAELCYLRDRLVAGGAAVTLVDVGTTPNAGADLSAAEVAAHHPQGAGAVLGRGERGAAVSAMSEAFTAFCATHADEIDGMLGIGGGGGTSIIAPGMRELPYGVPKLMVSTLASGDTAPFVGTSDMIMMPSVTDLAGLNRISRHILHNAAQAMLGMVAQPHEAQASSRASVGLSMFGVTTEGVTQVMAALQDSHDPVVFHATGTGGCCMEDLLAQGLLDGLIDITTTEIADELVGGVLSAGPARLDAVIDSGAPYVGSLGALDMVNFWAPETVPAAFSDRLFHHHNPNVTLMRTTADECTRIGTWIAQKLNRAPGPVCLLIPEKGLSALDVAGGPFWDPAADAALFGALEDAFEIRATHRITRLPYHINAPEFASAAAAAYRDIC